MLGYQGLRYGFKVLNSWFAKLYHDRKGLYNI